MNRMNARRLLSRSTRRLHHTAPAPIATKSAKRLGLSYLQAGDAGPAIVLLHGWGAFKELWWHTLGDLGRDHRCFAPDLPGHGESSLGIAPSIAGIAEQVATLCDELGLNQIALVGHSMGGSVAVELALARPELVRCLLLVDAAVNAQQMPTYTRTYLQASHGWAAFRISQLLGRQFRPLGMRVPHDHGGGWLRPWLRRAAYLATYEPEGLHRILRSLFGTDAGARLASLGLPTLVLSGQIDVLVPTRLSRRLARQIPGAHFVSIPGALHNPMDERPRAFVRAVRAFLARYAM